MKCFYRLNDHLIITRLRNLRFLRYLKRCLENLRINLFLKNPLREFKIRRIQKRLLEEYYSPDTDKLIIFLTPGFDAVGGGILSITSIYSETIKLNHIHGAKVIMCTIPGDPLLLRYTKFKNQNYMYTFSDILSYFQNLHSVLIHIPEYCIHRFIQNYLSKDHQQLHKIKFLHINVMLQNIDLVSFDDVKKLATLGKLTCTTAHDAYSIPEIQEKLGCPLHKLSVYVSPEQYDKKSYSEKENLMIVSPDRHEMKQAVLSLMAKQFPQLRIQIIRDLTYDDYKEVLSRAKWALTFGEGLDGYFVETVFSGGISFSVYNTKFFTEDFKILRTVYTSHETLIQSICSNIKELDNEQSYVNYQQKQYVLCSKHYNYKRYVANTASFYSKYFPIMGS